MAVKNDIIDLNFYKGKCVNSGLFFKIFAVLLFFSFNLHAVSDRNSSLENEISEIVNKDENSTSKYEAPYIKVPFSILLDEKNPKIRIKIQEGEDINLDIENRAKEGYLRLIAFKNNEIAEDLNVTSDFRKEFNFADADEIFLRSYGKFFVECFKVEVIADMEFNVPEETLGKDSQEEGAEEFESFKDVGGEENESAKGEIVLFSNNVSKDINLSKEEKKEKEVVKLSEEDKNVVVETEIVSAEDEEAFLKATGLRDENETKAAEDNKIVLVRDTTSDKKEFLSELEEYEKESSSIEKSKKLEMKSPNISSPENFNAPLAKEEGLSISKPSIGEEKKDFKEPEEEFSLKDIGGFEEDKKSLDKKLLSQNDISFKKPKDTAPKPSIEDNEAEIFSEKAPKEEETPVSAPSFDAPKAPVISSPSLSLKTPVLKEEGVKSENSPSLAPPEIKETPLEMKKPNLAFKDEIKRKALVEERPSIPESGEISFKKPKMEKESVSFAAPKIERSDIEVKESEFGEKPRIEDSNAISKPSETVLAGNKITIPSPNFKENEPSIKEETSLSSAPSFEVKEVGNGGVVKMKKIEPKKGGEGKLEVYVLKDDKPIVGWIEIIDSKTKKIVANGDTFTKNPVTFTLPSGKYIIVITDKKVVPPLQEKFYDVEVLPGETVVKKTKFSQGTLTVNVTKNMEPTATAFVRIYDQRTRNKVIDDNTYRNNPIKVKLPKGLYYVEVEDYSMVPKQFKKIKDIKIEEGADVVKSVNFEEGELLLKTFKNNRPVRIRYEIYPAGERKKIKTGYTDENGEAELNLAAGAYDIRAVNKSTVLKSVKTFKNIKVAPQTLTELSIGFKEGKLRVFSERGGNPLYTNVSIYKPGNKKRLYFDFTSRSDGVVVMKLPVGVYDVVVRDHNIKRVFKRVRIKPSSTTDIHAKF